MQNRSIEAPQNIESECSLLSCVFIDENLIDSLADSIDLEEFFNPYNKAIYKAMLGLREEKKKIDAVSVLDKLKATNPTVDLSDYLTSILTYDYAISSFNTYLDNVKEAALRRKTIKVLNDLVQLGYNSETKILDYLDEVESRVFDISQKRKVSEFRGIDNVLEEVVENITKNAGKNEEMIGLDTGFKQLNHFTLGFQPDQLIILAARPAMGKSAFAVDLAYNIAKTHKTVAFFSLEMSAAQLVERFIAYDTKINVRNLKMGNLDSNSIIKLNTSKERLSRYNIYFDESSDVRVGDIRQKCRKLAQEKGLDFVVIDYLQLIKHDNDSNSDQQEVGKISRNLKLMAKELGIPVLALSQLSRAVEKREEKVPIMADLRDSGSIEQDADIVLFLYRDEYYNKQSLRKHEADLIIAKNRSGSTSDGIPLLFNGEYSSFEDKN